MAIAGVGVGSGSGQPYFCPKKSGERTAIDGSFLEKRIASEKKAPYSAIADANGYIQYKGVIFYCDDENQQICLEDVSDPKKVIRVPLEKGGCLVVNRENIGDLSRAITMFSGADVKRILTAIEQDAQCARKMNEIEVMENETLDATAAGAEAE